MANFNLDITIGGVQQSVSTIGELEQALRATKDELRGLEVGSEEFENMAAQARNLQNVLQDNFKEATNFNRSIGQLGESVSRIGSSVTAAFTIATSAISLFGSESEELTQAQVKAQQALALALSATTIAANASKLTQDLKNISDALGLNITRQKIVATQAETIVENVNTAATAANTAATETQAVATAEATAATKAAGTVITTTTSLLGPLVLAVGALTAAYFLFTSNTEDNTEAIKDNITQLEIQENRLKRSADAIERNLESDLELAKLRKADILEIRALEEELFLAKEKRLNDEYELTKDQYIAQFDLLEEARKQGNEADEKQAEQEIRRLSEKQDDLFQLLLEADKREEVFRAQQQDKLLKWAEEEVKAQEQKYKTYKDAYDKILKTVEDSLQKINNIEKKYREENEIDSAKSEAEKVKILQAREQASLDSLREEGIANALKITDTEKRERKLAEIELFYLTAKRELSIKFFEDLQQAQKEDTEKTQEETDKKIAIEERYALYKKVLENEISFGDQNIFDTKAALTIKDTEQKIKAAEDEIAIERRKGVNVVQQLKDLQKLRNDLAKAQQAEDEANARVEAKQREDNFKEQLEREGFDEQQQADLLNEFRKNNSLQLNKDLEQIDEQYRQDKKNADIQNEQEITQARIAIANQYIDGARAGLGVLNDLSETVTNLQLKRAKELNQSDEQIRKQAFKRQKALNIAGAVVNGAQAVVKGIAEFGPPPSPAGIAAIVTAGIITAAQIAKIASQQYTGNETGITSGSSSSNLGGGDTIIQAASSGGFTAFDPSLVGTPFPNSNGSAQSSNNVQRVVVLESDITEAQRRVRVYEDGSTFG